MPRLTDAALDDFGERLRLWRVRQNATQAEAAKMLDINRSYLSQVERGRPPGQSLRHRFNTVAGFIPAAGVNSVAESSPTYGESPHASRRLRTVPILSWAQAGTAIDFEQIPADWDDVVPTDLADERAFGVRLRGDSMEPKFSEGDIAVLLPGTAATNGDLVIANIRDQGALCKIMHVQLDKNLIKLSSYNPAYPPTEYHRDEFNWIFPVATMIKQLRRR
jgi:phage repressor protein C with HTH and peptisase S24 domain